MSVKTKTQDRSKAAEIRVESVHDLPEQNSSTQPLVQPKHNTIEQLVADREKWETTTYKNSNDQLYGLLQRCYQVYMDGRKSKPANLFMQTSIDSYMKAHGIKASSGTHMLNKIVKCVFGADRRRVSAYGIALRVALQDKVKPSELPQYIRDKGGVEELRLAKAPNAMTQTQKAETGAKWVESSQVCSVQHEDLSQSVDAAQIGCQHVLIVTQEADGSFMVNALVSNAGVVKAALAAYYNQTKAQHAEAAAETAETNTDTTLSLAIDAALAA